VVTPISTILTLGLLLLNIFKFYDVSKQGADTPFFFVFGYIVIQLYIMYVVYFFMKDLEVEIYMSSAIRSLTDEEIAEFSEGLKAPPFRVEDLDLKTQNLMDAIHYQRYKKELFEIDEALLEIGNY
jgi:hypothetical protein